MLDRGPRQQSAKIETGYNGGTITHAWANTSLFGIAASQPLDVRIMPSEYQVGDVKSSIATPVADEVVRLKPKKVLMAFCRTTPLAKTMQFVDELRARLQTDLKGVLLENCPES
jgi:hypothetical protein